MIDKIQLKQDIYNLSTKIAQLQYLQEQKISEISIFVSFTDSLGGFRMKAIDQQLIPFSLQGELELLIDDSIKELQRQVESYKTLL